jgi:3-dehydroquinate synthase
VSVVDYNFQVATSTGAYTVNIGRGILHDALKHVDCLILDQQLAVDVGHNLNDVVLVDAGESLKTLDSCSLLLAQIKERGLTKSELLGACGGGSVQDVATLAASLYMRGVQWEFFPSTAMAALDSCIGGKSAINVGSYKNLAGNFYPPAQVTIDVALLDNLPSTAISAGLAEAVKICFARGAGAFTTFLELQSTSESGTSMPISTALVEYVLLHKAWFVEVDEFDRAERQLLNFGHTFAHALEAASGFAVPHGIAVAYGVTAACLHPLATEGALVSELIEYNCRLVGASDYPPDVVSKSVDSERFSQYLNSDKKGTPESLMFILPGPQGKLERVLVPRGAETQTQARTALSDALQVLEG